MNIKLKKSYHKSIHLQITKKIELNSLLLYKYKLFNGIRKKIYERKYWKIPRK